MINDESRTSVEWFARNISATELLENNDANGIVEIVGDWVDENCDYDEDDDDDAFSELCFVFYEFWGCENIPSHSPEWDKFWNDKLMEEDG
jgi:hypothetical protein